VSVHPADRVDDLEWVTQEDGSQRAAYDLYPGEYGHDFTRPKGEPEEDGWQNYSCLLGPMRMILVRDKPGGPVRFAGTPRSSRGLGEAMTKPYMDSDNIADIDHQDAL
jgi:hypothetical protein